MLLAILFKWVGHQPTKVYATWDTNSHAPWVNSFSLSLVFRPALCKPVSWSYPRHQSYFREKKSSSLLFCFCIFFSFVSFFFCAFFVLRLFCFVSFFVLRLFSFVSFFLLWMDPDKPRWTQSRHLASACVSSLLNLELPLLTILISLSYLMSVFSVNLFQLFLFNSTNLIQRAWK